MPNDPHADDATTPADLPPAPSPTEEDAEPTVDLSLLTQRQVATLLGLTPRQVAHYTAAGMPRRPVRAGRRVVWRFEAPAVVQWWSAWHADQLLRASPGEASRRRAAAEARLAELRVAEAERRVVPVDEAAEQVTRLLTGIRAQLLGWPGRMAPRVWGARSMVEVQAILDDAVRDLMTTLARDEQSVEEPVPGAAPRARRARRPARRAKSRARSPSP